MAHPVPATPPRSPRLVSPFDTPEGWPMSMLSSTRCPVPAANEEGAWCLPPPPVDRHMHARPHTPHLWQPVGGGGWESQSTSMPSSTCWPVPVVAVGGAWCLPPPPMDPHKGTQPQYPHARQLVEYGGWEGRRRPSATHTRPTNPPRRAQPQKVATWHPRKDGWESRRRPAGVAPKTGGGRNTVAGANAKLNSAKKMRKDDKARAKGLPTRKERRARERAAREA